MVLASNVVGFAHLIEDIFGPQLFLHLLQIRDCAYLRWMVTDEVGAHAVCYFPLCPKLRPEFKRLAWELENGLELYCFLGSTNPVYSNVPIHK